MITNDGKAVINEFFGGQIGRIATQIVLGTGTTAEDVTDVALAAEVVSLDVTTIRADLANNRIVFKAVLPAGRVPTIYEIGIVSVSLLTRLVARTVLVTPEVTDANLPTEIEYSLTVTV